MIGIKTVRQGAIVITIMPDASVSYELCLPVPYGYPTQQGANYNVTYSHKKGHRKFIRYIATSHKDVMQFKLSMQIEVQEYKNKLGEERRVKLLEHLSQL